MTLHVCPECGQRTVEYDTQHDEWSCVRFRCPYWVYDPKGESETPPQMKKAERRENGG